MRRIPILFCRTCKYFQNIIEDLKLWRFMDCRAEPNTSDKVDYCIKKSTIAHHTYYLKQEIKTKV